MRATGRLLGRFLDSILTMGKALTRRDAKLRRLSWVLPLVFALPWPARATVAEWLGRGLARLSPLPFRIAQNVGAFFPDLPKDEVKRIAHRVPGQLARTMVEILSGDEFLKSVRDTPLAGPGVEALERARAARQPVVLATAHFGNYEVARLALLGRGYPLAAVYRPLADPELNKRYMTAMQAAGGMLFANDPTGMRAAFRHLKGGGMVGILMDVMRGRGVPVPFFGRTVRTITALADLALRTQALLVPIWSIRDADRGRFHVQIDAPIPHNDPVIMTAALNKALEAVVRAHPEQWLWWHRLKETHLGTFVEAA